MEIWPYNLLAPQTLVYFLNTEIMTNIAMIQVLLVTAALTWGSLIVMCRTTRKSTATAIIKAMIKSLYVIVNCSDPSPIVGVTFSPFSDTILKELTSVSIVNQG